MVRIAACQCVCPNHERRVRTRHQNRRAPLSQIDPRAARQAGPILDGPVQGMGAGKSCSEGKVSVPGKVRSRVPQGPLRDMLLPMEALNGEIEAAKRLKRTALRDFGVAPPEDREDPRWDDAPSYRITISPNDAPVPDLYKYALNLIGCPARGPGEKVLWWVNFAYREEPCSLAMQKFGLRLYLRTERPEDEAVKTKSRSPSSFGHPCAPSSSSLSTQRPISWAKETQPCGTSTVRYTGRIGTSASARRSPFTLRM